MRNIAVIFAGGSGQRMGSGIPKQFIEVEGKPIIIHTLEIFEDCDEIDAIYIACKADCIDKLDKLIKRYVISKVKQIVPGGVTGQDSIYNGIKAAFDAEGPENLVLIHDGVRPCVTQETIRKAIALAKEKGSAVTCNTFIETAVTSSDGDIVEGVHDRKTIFRVVAPQVFKLGDVYDAHTLVRKDNPDYEGIIDTCTLMRSIGKEVHLVEGNKGNIKVTTPEDLYIFRAMLEYRENQQALGLSEKDIREGLSH